MANVCYLGFADPPEGPQVPLISFDAEVSEVDYDNLNDTAPKSYDHSVKPVPERQSDAIHAPAVSLASHLEWHVCS